jgi:hypothetical protein
MVSEPEALGVKFTEHVPLERVQEVWSKPPAPEAAHETVPEGVEPLPDEVSVTVAVQEVLEPVFTADGVHVTCVDVARPATVNSKK